MILNDDEYTNIIVECLKLSHFFFEVYAGSLAGSLPKKVGTGRRRKILPKGMTCANEKPYCFVEVYAAVTNRWNWLSPVAFLRKKTGASMWLEASRKKSGQGDGGSSVMAAAPFQKH